MLRTGHLPIIGEGEHVEVCDIFVVSFLYPLLALFLVYELPDILIHKLTLKHKHEKQISFRVTLVTMAIHYNNLSLTFITIVIHNNSLSLNFITIVIHYKSSNLLASQQASFSECLTSLKCPWWGYIHSINKRYKGWFYLIYGNLEKIKLSLVNVFVNIDNLYRWSLHKYLHYFILLKSTVTVITMDLTLGNSYLWKMHSIFLQKQKCT